jgi:hypothetical protein
MSMIGGGAFVWKTLSPGPAAPEPPRATFVKAKAPEPAVVTAPAAVNSQTIAAPLVQNPSPPESKTSFPEPPPASPEGAQTRNSVAAVGLGRWQADSAAMAKQMQFMNDALQKALGKPTKPLETTSNFQGLVLPALDGSRTPLDSCSTGRCLTVYCSPTCKGCREAIFVIRGLREVLKTKGIATRVVIGQAALPAVEAYAHNFGGDTLLDPAGTVKTAIVPHFYVSDAQGKVLRDLNGVPRSLKEGEAWVLGD